MPPSERDLTQHDPLDDFDARELTFLGQRKTVFVAGEGPAVIVMAEIPGIYPHVARFARWVRDAGFTVWMPNLFGVPGRPVTADPMSMLRGMGVIARACISREFRAFAADASSPVIDWLRALAAHAHPLCGGRGVGAIGMCFTGNFALSLMLEPAVRAPVLSQPSLPILQKGGMHIAPDELAAVKARMEQEDLTVLAYRFAGDSFCRAERFAASIPASLRSGAGAPSARPVVEPMRRAATHGARYLADPCMRARDRTTDRNARVLQSFSGRLRVQTSSVAARLPHLWPVTPPSAGRSAGMQGTACRARRCGTA